MKQLIAVFFLFTLLFTFSARASGTDDEWEIQADSQNNYNGVTLANGRIGLVSSPILFHISEIILNGVYDKEYAGGVSRVVRAPLFTSLTLRINGEEVNSSNTTDWHQTLNMRHASLTTTGRSRNTRISYTLRALRHLPYLMFGEVAVTPEQDIELEVVNAPQYPEELQNCRTHFKMMRDGKAYFPVTVAEAESRTGMHRISTCTSFLFDDNCHTEREVTGTPQNDGMSFKRKLTGGETYRFALIGAVCTSHNFYDAKNEAERMVVYALQQSMDALTEGHNKAWEHLWESDILIEGCPQDQQDIRLALYHLYSFQRKGSRLSISPMGLSTSTGYNGHIFWDSEFWMYPPVLLLNQDLARAHIDYRTDRLKAAQRRAANYGYEGAMYPWESDDSGEEATPTWCLTGPLEQHITADIAIAFWNYFRVTRDTGWLRREGYPVIKAAADFWVSRCTRNDDGSYSIRNVVGADEYAPNVNDNAFTNGSAKVALLSAVKAAEVLGEQPGESWASVAGALKFHYMPDGTMAEHADYKGEMIKQADVNLLAYPLQLVSQPEAIRRDLNYYESRIDRENGPAMGFSILSILESRMGNAEKAYRFFKRAYLPNKRPPFGVLSESPASNNPYFATGAGGLLQAVLFGFGGLELTDEGIIQHQGILPEAWKSLTIRGVGPEKKTYIIR